MNIASTLQTTLSATPSKTSKMTLPMMAKRVAGAALLGATLLFAPGLQTAAQARVFFSAGFAPPAIPVYEQPLCPGDGYLWTPGYWAWTDEGYQWIDGAWVTAPYVGALWTPGYWGFNDGAYLWNAGYWGREVGYYGGINYGFGYFGTGFYGGYWGGDRFVYNRAYNHFDRGFRGSLYDRREGGFDGRPGGAAFVRDDRGFHDDHRGSFVGGRELHNDHREAFNGNRPNGGSFDQQRGFAGQQQGFAGQQQGFAGQQQGFAGQQNSQNQQDHDQRGFQGGLENRGANQPQQTYPQPRQLANPQPAQSFGGYTANRGGFQNDGNRPQPQQGFPGAQNPGATRGGAYNNQQMTRPAPDQSVNGNRGQSNAMRSNNTPTMQNNAGGRGFAGGNPAPAAPPQGGNFHGAAPATNREGNQGGGFHGGDNRSSHR